MAALQIACPKCGKMLKLPDRSLLGRKGKCSKCGHSFILEEPDEVQLELAEPAASQPPAGTSPRWVPDPAATMLPGYPAGYPMPPQQMPPQQWQRNSGRRTVTRISPIAGAPSPLAGWKLHPDRKMMKEIQPETVGDRRSCATAPHRGRFRRCRYQRTTTIASCVAR